MRPWAAALLLLPIGGSTAHADGEGLVGGLPAAVGDVSTWTVVSGEFDNGLARGHYRLYVSPERRGLYQLMRYDVQFLAPGNDLERGRRPGERLVFVARPGSREPLLCWERNPTSGPGSWRPVPPGTDAYRLEMMTLMRVLAVHRAAREAPDR